MSGIGREKSKHDKRKSVSGQRMNADGKMRKEDWLI